MAAWRRLEEAAAIALLCVTADAWAAMCCNRLEYARTEISRLRSAHDA